MEPQVRRAVESEPPPTRVGRVRDYDEGSIFWSPASGAWWVHGAIAARWNSMRGIASALGYPTSDESGGENATRFQEFQNGAIYCSTAIAQAQSGDCTAVLVGPIWNTYRGDAVRDGNGFLSSTGLGIPISDATVVGNSTCISASMTFEKGTIYVFKDGSARIYKPPFLVPSSSLS